jgi:plastocyanin
MRIPPAVHAVWVTAVLALIVGGTWWFWAQPVGRAAMRRPAAAEPARPAAPARSTEGGVVIEVNADGTFSPATVDIRPGTRVVWKLADRYRDSIAPLRGEGCEGIAPYDGGPEDFTGPMPRNASGVFVLNQDGPGLVVVGDRLQESGPLGAVTEQSWKSPDNVGAFLRLRWNWIQPTREGEYDWTVVDREVSRAAANGKLYSISVKAGDNGTPGWIFDAGVEKLTFREFGTAPGVGDCKCGSFMELGDPTDDRYQELYFGMLEALAAHLKSNAAWYRHLAYIKPSGANLYSAENRLPKRCSCEQQCPGEPCKVPREFQGAPNLAPDGRICNTKVWADAGYTPEGLYRYYDRQLDGIGRWFPDKDMAFLLIHDGFPQVDGRDFRTCGEEGKEAKGVPQPTQQTREVIRRGWAEHKERFALMHAALRADHPINNLLTKERQPTQIVGLQTTNEITDGASLERAIRYAMANSPVTFIEAYEAAALTAGSASSDLNESLHARRREQAPPTGPLQDPFPPTHDHTFEAPGTYRYVNPYRCNAGSAGVIRVAP